MNQIHMYSVVLVCYFDVLSNTALTSIGDGN